MIVADDTLQHRATSVNFDANKWLALYTVIDSDTVTTEVRWSRGGREIHTTEL